MEQKNLEINLARITAEILTVPHYNSKFPYANIASQMQSVNSRLRNLQESGYIIKQPIKDYYNVIPVNAKETRLLQNYGQSASDCLVFCASSPDETKGIGPLVISFLEAVKLQAQKACDEIAEENYTRDAQAREEYNKRFQEYVDDLERRQTRLDTQFKNTQSAIDGLQNLVEDVHKSIETAVQAVSNAQGEAEKAQGAADNANTKADEAKKMTIEAKDIANGMIPNMLTILGIFVGVIIAVVACYLTILLTSNDVEAISTISIPLGFMFAWMMGHIMIVTVFLLLYLTAKITNRTLSCCCSKFEAKINTPTGKGSTNEQGIVGRECSNCKKKCKSLICFKFRYPYIYWINVIFVVGYVVLFLAHLIDIYYLEYLRSIITCNIRGLVIFAASVVVAVIITAVCICIKIKKETPQ